MSKKLRTLDDLLEHELQDLYSAETQIIEALPKMEEKASSKELKKALSTHLKETKNQQKRIEKACKELNIEPSGDKCKAVEGLIKEAEKFLKEDAEKEVLDAGIIAMAQRVEHYEISAYGTACHYAQRLGHDKVADLLEETLEEEKHADSLLNEIALEKVNEKAEA